MAAVAESLLKTGEVSAMIRQGFIPSTAAASPPSPSADSPPSSSAAAASTTLLDMIAQEDLHRKPPYPADHHRRRLRLQDRIARVLAGDRPDWETGNVELSVSSGEGFRVSMVVHSGVLAAQSRFFSEKLAGGGSSAVVVEICDCDDVEVYVEVVAMMYSGDLRRGLVGEQVMKILGLLKVSAAIMFDAGVTACLEYLECVPWSEDEEAEVISVLRQLHLHEPATDVLERVFVKPSSSSSMRADSIFLHLLSSVLRAKDEKARRDAKALISGLLKEDEARSSSYGDRLDISRETLYHLCHKGLNSLHHCLSEAASMENSTTEIAQEANNLQWLLEILTNKKMAEEFVLLWADQKILADLHSRIPCMYRYEISRITAQLCVSIGKGHILVSKNARFSLLETWLEALYKDFGWMRRACRALDKKAVEDGLCRTILTLSMAQQQVILLRWFDCFVKKGDDCPDIQKAFEVWWRRAFVRRYSVDQDHSHLQIAVSDYPP